MVGGLVLLMLVAAAPTSPERIPLAKVLRGEALESYLAARADFKAQRYPQALAGFVRAQALSKDPRLLWNSAACLRKLERNAEALRNLDAYIAQGTNELSDEELDEARRSQVAVRELVATLRITTVPSGAAIAVDGAGVSLAPGEPLYLAPGPHTFRFTLEGHEDLAREETVRGGERIEWKLELVALRLPPSPTPVATAKPLQVPPVVVRRPWTPWLVVGGGAVVGVAGGLLLGTADGDYTRLKQQCGSMCPPPRVGASRSLETAGVVLVGVGAAAAIAGLGWWLFSGTEARAQVRVSPAGATLEARF